LFDEGDLVPLSTESHDISTRHFSQVKITGGKKALKLSVI